jgi:SAM-dependent methyltransferase
MPARHVVATPRTTLASAMSDNAAAADLVRTLVRGGRRAQVLAAVLRLGIPDALGDGAVPLPDLAAGLGVGAAELRRLLRAARAIGLFREAPRGWLRNSPASSLLRAGVPGGLRDEARHVLSTWTRIAWDGLEHSVRTGRSGFVRATGRSVFEFLRDHPGEAAVFHAFQAEVARRNLPALLAAGCLPRSGSVVDVGGGGGALLAAMLRTAPGLRGTLFDLPEVIDRARRAPRPELGDRLRLVAGDVFREVPAGADAYVLAHVLHDWPDARAARILERVAAAMTPASRVLVIENVRAGSGSSLLLAYLDVQMLAAWEGRERTLEEYRRLLRGAGLALAESRLVEPRGGLSVLTASPQEMSTRPDV